MIGDLHCHTKMSDGSLGIEDVILLAKKQNLDFLSITDHDTINSINRAKILAQRYDIKLISGIELSCYDYKRNQKVHILCYMPEKPDRLEGHCLNVANQRKEISKKMIEIISKQFPITLEDVQKIRSDGLPIYKQHIIYTLMEYGYTTKIYGGLYGELFNSKTGCAYIPLTYPDVYDVIELVHQSQGLVVLAHPYEYHSIDLLHELAKKNLLDGIEVYHSRCSKEQEEELFKIANHYNLCMTGGSDFHGFFTSKPTTIGSRHTTDEMLERLFDKKKELMEIY